MGRWNTPLDSASSACKKESKDERPEKTFGKDRYQGLRLRRSAGQNAFVKVALDKRRGCKRQRYDRQDSVDARAQQGSKRIVALLNKAEAKE